MRIGFIGAGAMASRYLQTLDELEDVRVTAVCDIDGERAHALAEPRGARVYHDYRQMLDAERFDAVFVAIPPYAHTNQVALAAQHGAAVFVAAPIGLDISVAVRTAKAIAKTGVVNAVGYAWRYARMTERARELLKGRPIGLVIGEAILSPASAPWWRRRELSGGQIVEQTTHLFDLARYLVGEAQTVSAWGSRRMIPDRVDFEDATVVNLKFADACVGSITSTCAAPDDDRCTLELVARDARLKLDFSDGLTGQVEGERIDETAEGDDLRRPILTFLEAIRMRNQSLIRSSFRDGVASLALTLAAERSILTGRWEPVVQG